MFSDVLATTLHVTILICERMKIVPGCSKKSS